MVQQGTCVVGMLRITNIQLLYSVMGFFSKKRETPTNQGQVLHSISYIIRRWKSNTLLRRKECFEKKRALGDPRKGHGKEDGRVEDRSQQLEKEDLDCYRE